MRAPAQSERQLLMVRSGRLVMVRAARFEVGPLDYRSEEATDRPDGGFTFEPGCRSCGWCLCTVGVLVGHSVYSIKCLPCHQMAAVILEAEFGIA